MINKITHRLGWKILSVVLAFFLWLLVVNYEDPYITDTFTLEVEKINENAITSLDKAIEYKEGLTVNVTVKGKRTVIGRLSERDMRAYADLSKVSITGAIDIQFDLPEGVSKINNNPSDMTIVIENMVKAQKEIRYYFEGVPADHYDALNPIINPNIVQISGPESLVNQVSSVLITITIEDAKKDITLYATPVLYDNSQKEVKGVDINVDRVSVMVPIEKTKIIPIIVSDVTDLPEGYVITHQEQDLDEITIRGPESVIDTIDSLNIKDISLEGKTENTPITADLEKYLPDTVYIKNNDIFVNLNYTITKVEEKTISVQSQDVSVKNIPEGLKFSYVDDLIIEMIFNGIQSDLDKITLESLNPTIRLLGLLPGEQQTQLFYTLPKDVSLVSEPPVLNIILVEEEETTTTE